MGVSGSDGCVLIWVCRLGWGLVRVRNVLACDRWEVSCESCPSY